METSQIELRAGRPEPSSGSSGKFKALDEHIHHVEAQTHHIELLLENQSKSLKHMFLLGVLVVAGCIAVTLGVVLTRDVHASGSSNMVDSSGSALSTRATKGVLVVLDTQSSRRSRALLARQLAGDVDGVVVAEMACAVVERASAEISNGAGVEIKLQSGGRTLLSPVTAHSLSDDGAAFSILGATLEETPCSLYDVVCDRSECEAQGGEGTCPITMRANTRKAGCGGESSHVDKMRRMLRERAEQSRLLAEGPGLALQGGRRSLQGRRLGKGSPSGEPTGGPQCSPCANPCPATFDYNEKCGYWWWEDDVVSCTPRSPPATAAPQQILDIKYTGCPCSTFGNCEGTVKGAEQCSAGQTELSLETDCCSQPFANNGCEARWGTHETRKCVSSQLTTFALTDGSRKCPDLFFEENKNFEVCKFCDGVQKVEPSGAFATCWLPYNANAEGDCLAYDAANVGWYDNGKFAKGGSEKLLPKFNGRN